MKYYLYKFEDNWSDELDVKGFAPLTKDEKDLALAQIKRKYRKGGTISFGSNQENDYDDISDVLACIEFEPITNSQYNTLIDIFGQSFGELGPLDIDDIEEDDEDEEIKYCEECGDELEDYEDDICSSCEEDSEEENENKVEYFSAIGHISHFISTEYNLINNGPSAGILALYDWRPTPNTRIKITIPDYVGDDSESVKLEFYSNNRLVLRKSLYIVDEEHDNYIELKDNLKMIIDNFLNKAKKH